MNCLAWLLLLAVPLRVPDPALVPSPEALRAQVKEPLFAFALTMVAADSLGTWTADDLAAFAADWGQPTDLPLARVRSIAREPVPGAERRRAGGAESRRRLVITLEEDRLSFPMPYSILGYHPGSVEVRSPLVFDEWSLGSRVVDVRAEGGRRKAAVDGLTAFQLTGGALYLDVDAWLDGLLGDAVDDAWTVAYAVGWEGDHLFALGVSTGRRGRRIFGELDLRTGEVEVHGRPFARGVAAHVRELVTDDAVAGPRPWSRD